MCELTLATLEDTERLARLLARSLLRHAPVRAVLLRGPMGGGKTTFACALARALPGGEGAETGSPSFTLCNRYPTRPEVLHGDLYRCQAFPPEEITEALQEADVLTILEWAEFLPEAQLPEEFLDVVFSPRGCGRLLRLRAGGPRSGELLRELRREWP
ncbi:MAG: tRNA (adenosine(37)-N6)-threonylcarbamoyltransferase complex ATPase subunit type 1 TsaE [Desulfovibrio sp.]|nr:tRNA (adenosine(37)-N6)-threonylcarbamoyltransferase complex ATPase subunit type 1 TsaE [Desulfovibrio sp.]